MLRGRARVKGKRVGLEGSSVLGFGKFWPKRGWTYERVGDLGLNWALVDLFWFG